MQSAPSVQMKSALVLSTPISIVRGVPSIAGLQAPDPCCAFCVWSTLSLTLARAVGEEGSHDTTVSLALLRKPRGSKVPVSQPCNPVEAVGPVTSPGNSGVTYVEWDFNIMLFSGLPVQYWNFHLCRQNNYPTFLY